MFNFLEKNKILEKINVWSKKRDNYKWIIIFEKKYLLVFLTNKNLLVFLTNKNLLNRCGVLHRLIIIIKSLKVEL